MDFLSWMPVFLLIEATEFSMGQQMQPVDQCPRNQYEWNIRATAYNCAQLPANGTYHCALNENGTGLLEVCAHPTNIHGHRCTEFNTGGTCLQDSFSSCEDGMYPCPYRYLSTEAYKYQSCYEKVYGTMPTCKVTDQRSDLVKKKVKQKQNNKLKHKQNREQNHVQNREQNHVQNREPNHVQNREQTYEPSIVNNHKICYISYPDIIKISVIVAIFVIVIHACILFGGFAVYSYLLKKKRWLRDPSETTLQNEGAVDVIVGLVDQ